MRKSFPCAVTALLFLCGCQSPIVPVRHIGYSVSYSVDGRRFEGSGGYTCYYEDIAWLSERGADWHIRGDDGPVFLTGTLQDGTRFVIQPVDTRFSGYSPKFRCVETDPAAAVDSELFIRSKADPQNLESFDAFRTASGSRQIQVDTSQLRLHSEGKGVFQRLSAPKHGRLYYTISARILSGPEIERAGLRNYVASRKSIWLKEGAAVSAVAWHREDVEAARQYSETVPYLYHPSGGVELTGQYTKQGWNFTNTTSHTSITWIASDLTEREAAGTPDNKLPTTLVNFGGAEIEIPVAKYSAHHFYNPRTDELIVFYVYKTEVPDSLL